MIYTFLISIVFIAELIIAITLIRYLLRLDKIIISFNEKNGELTLKIGEIANLIKKISEQWVILSKEFVKNTKRESEDFLIKKFSKILLSLILLRLNFGLIKKIRKSKVTKFLVKSCLFVENMI